MNQTIDSGYGNIKEVTKNTEIRPPEIRSLRSLPAVKCCLREMSLILTISRATIAAINKILYTITTLLFSWGYKNATKLLIKIHFIQISPNLIWEHGLTFLPSLISFLIKVEEISNDWRGNVKNSRMIYKLSIFIGLLLILGYTNSS